MRRAALIPMLSILVACTAAAADDRPNILWITSEDNGPHLGCYGDPDADTPNLDRLAEQGVLYEHCWSTAPVCSAARTALITGLYPTATGAEHHRSMTRLPAGFRMLPQHLRDEGYYCTNRSKEDFNLQKPGRLWDAHGQEAHWRGRAEGQPFFSVFNLTITHESRIRTRPHATVHDPDSVRVPAYHPDVAEVRRDWAQYHDRITEMDRKVGTLLAELAADGLAGDTIVFYFADHGSGLPRCKRSPYDSGLRVPLIVRIPPRFRHLAPPDHRVGDGTDRLVGFVDFAPTVLSLAGIEPPAHLQGFAFMGPFAAGPQQYVHGFRGRMDERYDMQRSVRDHRFVYVRNYAPHRVSGQHVEYMFRTPTTRAWKALHDRGALPPEQDRFWRRKPAEELYDLETDPDEVRDLAAAPEHRATLLRLRAAQRELVRRVRDVGFLPEPELRARTTERTPWELGRDEHAYPLDRIAATAELATMLDEGATPVLIARLGDDDAAVRYWAATGLLVRGSAAVAAGREGLRAALGDSAASVRVVAAEALAAFGRDDERRAGLTVLLDAADVTRHGVPTAVTALNALDELDGKAAALGPALAALPRQHDAVPRRQREYVGRLLEKILADLDAPSDPR